VLIGEKYFFDLVFVVLKGDKKFHIHVLGFWLRSETD